MELREKYTRQFLRSSCDSQEIILPDLTFICNDGVTFAHKFMVLGFLPGLKEMICGYCLGSHEETKMIMSDVSKAEVDMARDFLYMFGDVEPFVKLFGGERIDHARIENSVNMSKMTSLKDKNIKGTENNFSFTGESFSGAEMEKRHIEQNKYSAEKISENKVKDIGNSDKTSTITARNKTNAVGNENIDIIKKEEHTLYLENHGHVNVVDVVESNIEPNSNRNEDMEPDDQDTIFALENSDVVEEIFEKDEERVTHSSQPFYSCSKCKFKSKRPSSLGNHLKLHLNITYECDKCDYKGKNERSFKHHQLLHSARRFSCDECDYKGITKPILKNHKLIKHRGFRNNCDLCDYTSVSRKAVIEHFKGVHQGFRHYCNKCEFKTMYKSALKDHVDLKHVGVRFPCKFCEFLSSSRNYIRRHMALKHKDMLINE